MIKMTKRRDFVKKSVLGTAGIAIGGIGFSSRSYASIIGANERINMAVIGHHSLIVRSLSASHHKLTMIQL